MSQSGLLEKKASCSGENLGGPRMGLLLTGLLTLLAILVTTNLARIPQAPEYHRFADQRVFFGIPRFLDVVSNLPFVVFGCLGLRSLLRRGAPGKGAVIEDERERRIYLVFYLGVVLTGFGSAYYHLQPDHERLVWDRLAMTVAFMSLLASVIAERISIRAGLLLLFPLLVTGGGTVLYWIVSENAGVGDLRPYVLVQYYPVVLIVLLLWFFPSRYDKSGHILGMLAFYGLAKIFEVSDKEIFSLGQVVSGHTIKHLFAAMAAGCHLRMLSLRRVRAREIRQAGTLRQCWGAMETTTDS
jgi:hypothetical protein